MGISVTIGMTSIDGSNVTSMVGSIDCAAERSCVGPTENDSGSITLENITLFALTTLVLSFEVEFSGNQPI